MSITVPTFSRKMIEGESHGLRGQRSLLAEVLQDAGDLQHLALATREFTRGGGVKPLEAIETQLPLARVFGERSGGIRRECRQAIENEIRPLKSRECLGGVGVEFTQSVEIQLAAPISRKRLGGGGIALCQPRQMPVPIRAHADIARKDLCRGRVEGGQVGQVAIPGINRHQHFRCGGIQFLEARDPQLNTAERRERSGCLGVKSFQARKHQALTLKPGQLAGRVGVQFGQAVEKQVLAIEACQRLGGGGVEPGRSPENQPFACERGKCRGGLRIDLPDPIEREDASLELCECPRHAGIQRGQSIEAQHALERGELFGGVNFERGQAIQQQKRFVISSQRLRRLAVQRLQAVEAQAVPCGSHETKINLCLHYGRHFHEPPCLFGREARDRVRVGRQVGGAGGVPADARACDEQNARQQRAAGGWQGVAREGWHGSVPGR